MQGRSPVQQRMNFRLMGYWTALRGDQPFARIADFNVEAVPGFGQHAFMLDLHHEADDPLIRFVGQKLAADCGSNMIGLRLSGVPAESLLSRGAGYYREVLANKGPSEFAGEYVVDSEVSILYRGIMLPFTRDGASIDYIVGAITSKTVDGAQTAPLLGPAPESGGDAAEPGPGAEGAAKGLIALVESEMAQGEEADRRIDLGPLQNSLHECQGMARKIDAAESRSRKALYDTLERVYAFHLQSEADPDAFASLIDEAGLTLQPRAPFTPTVKLVFGAGYDKTRLSEYATALSFAKRHGQSAINFRTFLTAQAGGLKGCVKAERAARRAERGKPSDATGEARQALRQAPALGLITAPLPGDEEFVLLLGRRAAAQPGIIEVLSVLEENQTVLEGALRRAARKLEGAADTRKPAPPQARTGTD